MSQVVSLNWQCVWRLFWHGSETVTLPDGKTIEFRWVRGSLKPPLSQTVGEGCFVHTDNEEVRRG